MADRLQIHDVLYRYCRAIDRMQWGLLVDEVFHPDALIDKTGDPVPLAQWMAEVAQRHPGVPKASHMVMNPIVEFTGRDVAFVESGCLASERHLAGDGGDVDRFFRVRYGDVFERRQGRWRIARRSFVMDHLISVPFDPLLASPVGACQEGRRDADDPLLRLRATLLAR